MLSLSSMVGRPLRAILRQAQDDSPPIDAKTF